MISFLNNLVVGMVFAFEQEGESGYLNSFEFEKYALVAANGELYSFNLRHKKEIFVTNCQNTNGRKTFECLLNELESQTNCSFPWKQPKDNRMKCSTELLEKYKSKAKELYHEEPEKFGCGPRKCEIEYWKPELLFQSKDPESWESYGMQLEGNFTLATFIQFSKVNHNSEVVLRIL